MVCGGILVLAMASSIEQEVRIFSRIYFSLVSYRIVERVYTRRCVHS